MFQVEKAVQYFSEQIPDRVAIMDEQKQVTYKELHQSSTQWAHLLYQKGVAQSYTVIILMDNSTKFMQLVLALSKLRVRLVFINCQLTSSEIVSIRDKVSAQYIITELKYWNKVNEILESTANLDVLFVEREQISLQQKNTIELDIAITSQSHDSQHIIFFTSGSTGKPKGIAMDKSKFDMSYAKEATLSVHLIARPIYYRAHFSSLCYMLQEGKTIYLSSHVIPEKLYQAMDVYNVSHVILGSYDLLRTIQWLEEQNALFPASVKEIISTGMTISEKLKRKVLPFGPHVSFVDLYGTSECGAISMIGNKEWETKQGSVGRPLFFSKVMVVNQKGEVLPAHTTGEVCVKTPFSMEGYIEDEALNEETFVGDYIRTGDIGYLDRDGYIYLIGRKNNTINRSGNIFHVSDVEKVIMKHPEIHNATVVCLKDAYHFQIPVAYIELTDKKQKDDQWMQELYEYCRNHLAEFKIPAHFVIVDQLPLNAAGKVEQAKLQKFLPMITERSEV
ncbi:class I adenylate-forming enzyme family protein [Niallia sp. 03133]|uniref:class I adenylate-forming enzyme family protein n=1 Tax=Niallia sp. 03133 TaxID=3458060 RepID=UPI0040443C41